MSSYLAFGFSEVESNKLTWKECWVDAGEIKGISNLTPSAWTKEDLTTGSLSSVARQLIAVGTPRTGWEGLLNK